MFIDSDFNANSFGNFDTDAMQDNSLYASGEYYNAAASVNYREFVIKYKIFPGKAGFQNAGYTPCRGFMGILCQTPGFKIGDYSSNQAIKEAYDTKARSLNSHGLNLATMSSSLASVKSRVKNLVPFTSDMTCAEYVSVTESLNSLMNDWSNASVVHEFDRDYRAKYLSEISDALSKVSGFMDARDCNGTTSAIDTAQIAQNAAEAAAEDAAAAAELAQIEKETSDAAYNQEIELIKEESDAAAAIAAEDNAELAKRNKMIMIGAAIVIAVLILKKK
jgi:hypothetical protein